MPSKVKYQPPKRDQADVLFCDKCGLRPTFYSPNLSFFVCSACANRLKFSADDLKEISAHHISQLVPEKDEPKPFRPRKRKKDRVLHETIQSLESQLSRCERTDDKQRTSARLAVANEKLLLRHFSKSAN